MYQLTVPTSDWALVDKALSVLAEWAGRIRCGKRQPHAFVLLLPRSYLSFHAPTES